MPYPFFPMQDDPENDPYGLLRQQGQVGQQTPMQGKKAPWYESSTGRVNPLIPIGLNLVGNLFKAIKGDPTAKVRKKAAGDLSGMVGKDVYDVGKYANMNRRLMVPQANKYGEAVNKRFGFDQGRGQGEFFNQLMESEGQNLYNLSLENEKAKNERDMMIRQLLLNYRG